MVQLLLLFVLTGSPDNDTMVVSAMTSAAGAATVRGVCIAESKLAAAAWRDDPAHPERKVWELQGGTCLPVAGAGGAA
jgi:hypothetical protein